MGRLERLWQWVDRFQLPISLVGTMMPTGVVTWIVTTLDGLSRTEKWLVFCVAWLCISIGTFWAIEVGSRLLRHFGRAARQDRIASALRDYGKPTAVVTLKLAAGIWRGDFDIYQHHPQLTRLKSELSKQSCPSMVFADGFTVPSEFARITVGDFARYLLSIGEIRENIWPAENI